MNLSLVIASSRHIGTLSALQVYGQRVAGSYRLGITLRGRIREAMGDDVPVCIETLAGKVEMKSKAGNLLLGQLIPEQLYAPIEQFQHGQDVHLSYWVYVGTTAVEHLEQVRAAGDVAFRVVLEGIARQWIPADPARIPSSDAAMFKNRWAAQRVYGEGDFPVAQSEWVRVLAEMGYTERILVEVELPKPTTNADLHAAGIHLREAIDHVHGGRYRDAVGACRLSIERAQSVIGKPPPNSQDQRQYTKEERYQVAVESIRKVAHLAHHTDPVCSTSQFNRDDALAMIGMIASLLRIY